MKTIAQELNITDFPFEIKDKQGNFIYKEVEDGFWEKWEYDERGNKIYYENSNGLWAKWEWDSNGKQIYFENSKGTVVDDRPAPELNNRIIQIDGKRFKLVEV
jgi:hypothetical protein